MATKKTNSQNPLEVDYSEIIESEISWVDLQEKVRQLKETYSLVGDPEIAINWTHYEEADLVIRGKRWETGEEVVARIQQQKADEKRKKDRINRKRRVARDKARSQEQKDIQMLRGLQKKYPDA